MAIVLGDNLHGHFFGSAIATIFSQARVGKKTCEKNGTKLEERRTEEEIE